MELKVKNSYLRDFLKDFQQEDDIKVLSCLAILGIDTLKKSGINKISFLELQKRSGNSRSLISILLG